MATNETPEIQIDKSNQKLMGGWLPKEWLGTDPIPRRRKLAKVPVAEPKPQLTREQITEYRRKTYWLRAIINDNLKPGRDGHIPFGLDTTQPGVPGERYFLVLCQMLYRESQVKRALGEALEGEDLITRLVSWWAEGPLVTGNIHCAMRGTSVADPADSDEDDN